MSRYELARLNSFELVESSSSNTLDWAENELRKRFSRYVYQSSNQVKLISDSTKFDDKAEREFRKATEGLNSMMWWLLTKRLHSRLGTFCSY